MKKRTYKEQFLFSFKAYWILYVSVAVGVSCLLALTTLSWWSFLFLLAIPFWSLTQPLIERALYPGSFQWKIDNLTANIEKASEEPDAVKRAMLLSVAAMRNVNTCGIYYNYGHESEKHHFMFLMKFYEKARQAHREEASRLYAEKNS